MPNLNETKQALETMFTDGWGVTTPISYDNVSFDDTTIDEFVNVRFINLVSNNVNIGGAINKRKRHEGILSVKIFVKQRIGTGDAYTHAVSVANIMDNKTQSNLFTGVSDTRRLGEDDDGWFGLIVDVPYISDEI